MKKRVIKIVLSSSVLLITAGMILLVPVLMIYSFFGGEISSSDSDYVEGNIEYAKEYKNVLNKYITKKQNGYIPLSRILYFYNENPDLSFDSIYKNNLDFELKTMLPISEVCSSHYSSFDVCNDDEIMSSNQIDDYSYKPFNAPIDFDKVSISSYFAQERFVYNKFNVHYAWDFAAPAKTDVYSIGYGTVKTVRFNQLSNVINKDNGLGNYIEIEYEVEGIKYDVKYGHLYPYSLKVKKGDVVEPHQKIAEVGTTGYSTGNHLHFQVSKGNKKVDGMSLIDFNL